MSNKRDNRNNSWDAIWQDATSGFWAIVFIIFILWVVF